MFQKRNNYVITEWYVRSSFIKQHFDSFPSASVCSCIFYKIVCWITTRLITLTFTPQFQSAGKELGLKFVLILRWNLKEFFPVCRKYCWKYSYWLQKALACFKNILVTWALRCVIILQVLIHKLQAAYRLSVFAITAVRFCFKSTIRMEFTSLFSGCIHCALLIQVKAAASDKPTSYKTLWQYWIRCYYYITTFLIGS